MKFSRIFRKIKAFIKNAINKIRALMENTIMLVCGCVDDGRMQVVLGDIANNRQHKKDSAKVLHRIRVPTM